MELGIKEKDGIYIIQKRNLQDRMLILEMRYFKFYKKSKYFLCNLNENFEICKTYPRKLILPRFLTKEEIIDCSNFRTKNRLPSNR
jgi:hypothetical protein